MPPAEPGLPQRLGGVRKVIAERMLASLQSTAQLSYHADADVTELMARRSTWKAAGHAISLEDCLIYAIARTLEALPDFNGVADDVSKQYCFVAHTLAYMARPAAHSSASSLAAT